MISVRRGTNKRTVNVADNHDINTDGYDSDRAIDPLFDTVVDKLNIFDDPVGSVSDSPDHI